MKLFPRPNRSFRRLSVAAVASLLGCALINPAQAEEVLSFNLSARISTGKSRPTRSASAKVMTRNGRARVESRLGGTPVVGLYAPPYIYRLLPNTKSGTRYRIQQSGDADLQELLRKPSSLRATLIKKGAKKIGNATLSGQPVEGFVSSNYGGRGGQLKVWLRRRDGLPLQLDWKDKSSTFKASWSNYRKLADNAANRALFVAPSSYKIRDTAKATALAPGLM